MTDLHADLIDGIRGARPAVIGAAVLLALVASAWGVGYLQGAKSGQARSIEAEKQSQEAKGRADAAAEAARRAQTNEAQARAQVADADAKAARAAELVAKLRADRRPAPGVVPPADPGPLEPVALIDALASQVEAERVRVAARDAVILSLEAQRDGWKQAHDERHKETVSLRLALEGQKSAVNGARWRGRMEGFAVGAGLGFFAGRR